MAAPDSDSRAESALGDDEPLLAALVGHNWESHYRIAFLRFAAGGSRRSWNWGAALAPSWVTFRPLALSARLGLIALFHILYLSLSLLLFDAALGMAPVVAFAGAYAIVALVEGNYGDWLAYQRARVQVRKARSGTAGSVRLRSRRMRGASTGLLLFGVLGGAFGILVSTVPWEFSTGHLLMAEEESFAQRAVLRVARFQNEYHAIHGVYAARRDSRLEEGT